MMAGFAIRQVRADEVAYVLVAMQRDLPADDPASRIIRTIVQRDPNFRPDQLYVGEVGDVLVATVLVTERALRIGQSSVRSLLLVPVVSPTEDQGQDACSAIIHERLKRARVSGVPLALLWGHSWMYPRYGFAPGMKRYSVLLRAGMECPEQGAMVVRPATAADLAALQGCFEAVTRETTLAPLRVDDWEWELSEARQTLEVVVDAGQIVRGYVRWRVDEASVQVEEIAALEERSALALTGHMLVTAQTRPVVVSATPDNLWTRVMWQRGAEVQWSDGMRQPLVRVVDLRSLLTVLLPELDNRVGRSEYVAQHTALRLETPAGTVGLRIDGGRVRLDEGRRSTAALPFGVLTALVTGYRSLRDMLGEPGVQIDSSATVRLLEVLFPEGYPCWIAAPYY